MTYVISNIHGDHDAFKKMLDTISFGDNDIMYILGDIVDFGDSSMELIEDISMRYNVYPIVGDHDLLALRMLSGFSRMLKDGDSPSADFISEMTAWCADGGDKTLAGFRELDDDMKEGAIDYLSDMALFEEVSVGDKDYILVHAGFKDGCDINDLDSLVPQDLISESLDLRKKYFEDKTVIVGHEPTTEENGGDGRIFYGNGSINIDCGNMRGGRLACLCLDDGREYYV